MEKHDNWDKNKNIFSKAKKDHKEKCEICKTFLTFKAKRAK